MPIFLMHTIFAAGIRIVLLKLGIDHWLVHTVFGLAGSFGLPVLAAWIMKKLHTLDFILYPTCYIKLK